MSEYNKRTDTVYIEPSPSADSRTARGGVTRDELLRSSQMHINDVREALRFMRHRLFLAGLNHDRTKIKYIDECYRDFSQPETGAKFKEKDWYQKRHLTERHHLPDRCPEDVNLIDVIERVCDICMAGMARSGEVYDDKLDPEILERAYQNTIKLLLDHTVVIGPSQDRVSTMHELLKEDSNED